MCINLPCNIEPILYGRNSKSSNFKCILLKNSKIGRQNGLNVSLRIVATFPWINVYFTSTLSRVMMAAWRKPCRCTEFKLLIDAVIPVLATYWRYPSEQRGWTKSRTFHTFSNKFLVALYDIYYLCYMPWNKAMFKSSVYFYLECKLL